MSQSLRIGGVECNAHQPITWGRVGGVEPFTFQVELVKDRAEAIHNQAKYVDVQVNGGPAGQYFPVELAAGSTPGLRTLTLADARWEWPFKLIVRDFNVRRQTGDSRLVGPRVEVHAQVPRYDYAPYSLKGDSPSSRGRRWSQC